MPGKDNVWKIISKSSSTSRCGKKPWLAQDIASYLKNHPGKTWEQIFRDPVFREVAVQPVGTVGETFLVMALQKRILLHSEKSYEGQTLEEVLCAPGKAAAADLHFAGTPGLQEFFLAQGRGLDIFCHGFLVPILLPLKDRNSWWGPG